MNTFEHIPAETQEWHIASLVVRANETHFDTVKAILEVLPRSSIEASERNSGKIILVIEADNAKQLANLTDQIRITEHVLDAQLVYHQIADKETLDDTVEDIDFTLNTDLLETP